MVSESQRQAVVRTLQQAKEQNVPEWDAYKALARQKELQKILNRMSGQEKTKLLHMVYQQEQSVAGGTRSPTAPTVRNEVAAITTETILVQFENAVDKGLMDAVSKFSVAQYAAVMLYQFFLSFGVDLDFMALILLIMDGLTAVNVVVQIFSYYALISYFVAFCTMIYKVCNSFEEEPKAMEDGQVSTLFRWYHVVPLTRVVGFITMYAVENDDKPNQQQDSQLIPQNAVDKLSHFNTMIIVNMLSTLTVSIPTLFIGISRFSEGNMPQNEVIISAFALFQAGTSLTITFISMMLPGWTRICIDTVAEADTLELKKQQDKENRIQLYRYYSRLRTLCQRLARDLGNDKSSVKQKLREVKQQKTELSRTYNEEDPIEFEKTLMSILTPVVELDPLAEDMEDALLELHTDVKVVLRQVNEKVIEQKTILGYKLEKKEAEFHKENKKRQDDQLMFD